MRVILDTKYYLPDTNTFGGVKDHFEPSFP